MNDGAKLTRLLYYCTGPAKNVIQCCSVMKPTEGYKRARQLLKDRFGDEYVIAEAWVGKISESKPISAHDTSGLGLQEFADDLRNCEQTLTAMNYLAEINTQRVW